MSHDQEYLDLLRDVMTYGEARPDRTGTGVRSVFGRQLRFDLRQDFPLLTTKRIFFKAVVAELLWFLSGSTNSHDLERDGVTIWREWAHQPSGKLGPIYGHQWRAWGAPLERGPGTYLMGPGVDQIAALLAGLRKAPHDRAHIISAWNVAALPQMRLRPCHVLAQFYVGDGKLSCQVYQRSADVFLGLPFNIASYALLTLMTAYVTGLEPGELVHTLGDAHLYENHIEQARTQLERHPTDSPTIGLHGPIDSLDGWSLADVKLLGYSPHPAIPAAVAV